MEGATCVVCVYWRVLMHAYRLTAWSMCLSCITATTIKGKHCTFSLSKITQFQLLSVMNVLASLHLMNSDNLLTT